MRDKLRAGALDDREIELSVREHSGIPMIGGMGPDQLDPAMASMLEQIMPPKSKRRRATIAEARNILREEEVDKLIDRDAMIEAAIDRTEQSGIVFLDEIDKIASGKGTQQADVSRQGVQRDLLPIVEGSTVTTRHGLVKTDHILFIAAGAFSSTTVSDLMPELQGRFPIRVELDALTRADLLRILREPEHSLLKQQQALLATEGMQVDIDDNAVEVMADYAAQANAMLEDIGARRLMTIVERLFEKISFDAPDLVERRDHKIQITSENVKTELRQVLDSEDLSRFVL
jgi:ATP-dependent HslUV protease ATP-binding subunit HslU